MIKEAYIEEKSRELHLKIKQARSDIKVEGTTYYVSSCGDDRNDGKSPETAFKTLAKSSEPGLLKPGDAVLLRRGDVLRGHLRLNTGVTYSAYGEGEKPSIYGALQNAAELKWKKESENIYSISIEDERDIGCIVFNHGQEWGYKKFIIGDTELQMDRDYYHDIPNHILYLFSEKGNPAERWRDIELCPKVHGISGKANGTTIDGIIVKYCGAHGISIGSVDYYENKPPHFVNSRDVTIRNCEFEWIGGSIQTRQVRFGNGVEVWGGCENHCIENCYFNQIYDAALTQQYKGSCDCDEDMPMKVKNVVMQGNLFENNVYSYEYFLTENIGDTANVAEDSKWGFENVIFKDNICRNAGYGWGNQRPDRTTSAHIKSWSHFNNSENFVISGNIFDRGDYRLIEIKSYFDKCLPSLRNNIYSQYLGKVLIDSNSGTTIMKAEAVRNPQSVVSDSEATVVIAYR